MGDSPFLKKLAGLLKSNETLATRVFQLSTSLPNLPAFTKAISSFGKFTAVESTEIWELCQSQDTLNEAFKVPGLMITDSDVMEPDQPGGRPGLSVGVDKHVFKAPTSRSSALGLDRLAVEKRRERGEIESNASKRLKYEEEDEQKGDFKSEFSILKN